MKFGSQLVFVSMLVLLLSCASARAITFDASKSDGIDMCSIDDDSIVIAYRDQAAETLNYQILNINGTVELAEVEISDAVGNGFNSDSVTVTCLNDSYIAIAYLDENPSNDVDVSFVVYDNAGNEIVAETDVADDIGSNGRTAIISGLNDTHFVIGYTDDDNRLIAYAIYDSQGNQATSLTTIVNGMGIYPRSLSIDVFNETDFITFFGNKSLSSENTHTWETWDNSGSSVYGPNILVNHSSAGSYGAQIETLNDTTFVMVYEDDDNDDLSFAIYDIWNNSYALNVDIDTSCDDCDNFDVFNLNDTRWGVVWYDADSVYLSFALYDMETQVLAQTNLETWGAGSAYYYHAGFSQETHDTSLGLQNDMFAIAYSNTSTQNIIRVFYANGTEYQMIAAPTLNTLEEPTDPTPYVNGDSYYFNVTVCDDNGASEIDTVTFDWESSNSTITDYATVDSLCREYYVIKSGLGVATYTYNWYANDTTGQEATSDGDTWDVSQGTPLLTTALSPLILRGSAADYSGSESNSGDDDCTYVLYVNGTQVASGSSVTNTSKLSVATYNFTYTTTGCTNYTSASNENITDIITIYDWDLNDTYININESILLYVNASAAGSINATINKVGGDINVSLNWNGTHFIYNINKTDLGDESGNCSTVNITHIYLFATTETQDNISTSSFEYGTTSLTSVTAIPSESYNSVSDYVVIQADWSTNESTTIVTTCVADVNNTNHTMAIQEGVQRVSVSVYNWTGGNYYYSVYCTNDSYQSQSSVSQNYFIVREGSAGGGGDDGGGGGGGGGEQQTQLETIYVNETLTIICGDGICGLGENVSICPLDCKPSIGEALTSETSTGGYVVRGELGLLALTAVAAIFLTRHQKKSKKKTKKGGYKTL